MSPDVVPGSAGVPRARAGGRIRSTRRRPVNVQGAGCPRSGSRVSDPIHAVAEHRHMRRVPPFAVQAVTADIDLGSARRLRPPLPEARMGPAGRAGALGVRVVNATRSSPAPSSKKKNPPFPRLELTEMAPPSPFSASCTYSNWSGERLGGIFTMRAGPRAVAMMSRAVAAFGAVLSHAFSCGG